MLIYGAFNPPTRPLVLIVAGFSKITFIGLVLVYGRQFLGPQSGVSIAVDLAMVVLFIGYFIAARSDLLPASGSMRPTPKGGAADSGR
jgi:hypothetical protein